MHLLRERNKQRRQTAAVDRDDLPTVPFEEEEILPATSPKQHHHISTDNRQKVQVAQWVHKNKEDPAIKVCLSPTNVHSTVMSLISSRTLYHASRTISYLVSRTESTMAMS